MSGRVRSLAMPMSRIFAIYWGSCEIATSILALTIRSGANGLLRLGSLMGKCDDQRQPLPCEGRSYGPRETGTGFFDAGRYLRRQWAVSQRQRERTPARKPAKPKFIIVNAVIFRDGDM